MVLKLNTEIRNNNLRKGKGVENFPNSSCSMRPADDSTHPD